MASVTEDAPWSIPAFKRNFEAARHQQGGDVKFVALVTGQPTPEVFWTRGAVSKGIGGRSSSTNL